MDSLVLTLVFIAGATFLLLGAYYACKRAEHAIVFKTDRTFQGKWLFFGKGVKNGRISIGDGEYVVGGGKSYQMKHPVFGWVPTFFFKENHPEPIDPMDRVPVSLITASAIKKMGKMAAVEKLMSAGKKDFAELLIFLAIGLIVGVLAVMALQYTGTLPPNVGSCITDPTVIGTLKNMSMGV